MVISIKYCGGCNPYYDGEVQVKRIEAAIGAQLVPFDPLLAVGHKHSGKAVRYEVH